MTKGMDMRELDLGVLLEVSAGEEYSHIALRNVLDKYQYLEKQERAFLTRLVEGTLERRIELDYIIDQFSSVKVKKQKPVIREILRMSVYQLKYMDSVPDSAVCNEAVKLAQKKGFRQLKGFVNGVLRNIARNLGEIKLPPEKEPVRYLSVRYSMPEWMVREWLTLYGREQTETMLSAFYEKAPLTIRVNKSRISPAELKARLEAQDIRVQAAPYLDGALQVEQKKYPDKEIIPAGVFYYNIKDPMIQEKIDADVEAVSAGLMKELKMNGLVQADPELVYRMDSSLGSIPVAFNKDGSFRKNSSVADRTQFAVLGRYVRTKIEKIRSSILEGDAEVSPYELGKKNACTYCPYMTVCGFDRRLSGYEFRRLKNFSDEELWKAFDREAE